MIYPKTLLLFLFPLTLFAQNFEFAGETLFIWKSEKLYRQKDTTLKFEQVYPGNGADSIRFVLFISPVKGYLAAGMKLYRTTDSGMTWTAVHQNIWVGNSGALAAMGDMLLILGPNQTMLRSFDSGNSFDTVAINLPITSYNLISFMGASSPRYAVLYAPDFNPFTGQKHYLLSTDSCKTWNEIPSFGEKGKSRFISPKHGFIVTMGRVYATSDGGNSWDGGFNPGGTTMMPGGGAWADSLTAYQTTYIDRKLHRTTNGGTTWSAIHTGAMEIEYTVAGGRCVAFRERDASVIKYSSDKGNTWVTLDPATSVEGESPAQPESFVLHGNYPNPFNGSTVISFSSGGEATADLLVYSANGSLADKIKGIACKSGLNQIKWESKDLPSGVYFYSLRINGSAGSTLSGKMILLK